MCQFWFRSWSYFDLFPHTKNGILSVSQIFSNKISLKRDGEEVSIIFELPIYPNNPPAKWNDCNTVSVEISFFVISGFELELKEGYMHGDIDISSQDGNLKINISGNLKCSFIAETAVIQRFSAYIKENIDT